MTINRAETGDDPILFSFLNDTFEPDHESADFLLAPLRFYWDSVIQDASWLRPVPDAVHFAQKFEQHSKCPEVASVFKIRSVRVRTPESVEFELVHSGTGRLVKFRVHIPEFMSYRKLGTYRVPETAVPPPATVQFAIA